MVVLKEVKDMNFEETIKRRKEMDNGVIQENLLFELTKKVDAEEKKMLIRAYVINTSEEHSKEEKNVAYEYFMATYLKMGV